MKPQHAMLAALIPRDGFRVLRSFALVLLVAMTPMSAESAPLSADGAAQVEKKVVSDLAELQSRVVQVPVLRGEFQQEKHVQGFRNPLRSAGRFVSAREYGVWWQTLKPFPSDVVLTRDRILTRQADGRSRVELDTQQQPALRAVNALMFALMGGDVEALAAHFDLQAGLLPDDHWRLVLIPKGGAVARAFQQVTLEGDRFVRQVLIEEPNGDRTQLTFTSLTVEPAELDASEVGRFD